jgi:hypothetical protein
LRAKRGNLTHVIARNEVTWQSRKKIMKNSFL